MDVFCYVVVSFYIVHRLRCLNIWNGLHTEKITKLNRDQNVIGKWLLLHKSGMLMKIVCVDD